MLGLATFHGPHLVILDEPTNHLDIDSRSALITAINDFPGAVILVSHDRYLIEACADRIWLVADGDVTPFDGDLDDYQRLVLSDRGGNGNADRQQKDAAAPRINRTELRRAAAEKRVELAPLRRRIADAEAAVKRLTQEISRIDAALAAPGLFARDPAESGGAVEGARRGRRGAGARRGRLACRQCRVRSRNGVRMLAAGQAGGRFLAGALFFCGLRRRRRAPATAFDRIQSSAGKTIDAGPATVRVSQHDVALAGIAAEFDSVGTAGTLHHFALGHLQGDAALHDRRGVGLPVARPSRSDARPAPAHCPCGPMRSACVTGRSEKSLPP